MEQAVTITTLSTTLLRKALLYIGAPFLAMSASCAMALTPVSGFGTNPGNLQMFKHVPANMPLDAPLVVALHGCKQSAAIYESAGWSTLANAHKFYVVYPQQQSSNNMNNCLNWFESGDISRGQGEALSIKQMVDKMKADHSIDSNRVFVTGLSAGGAFTNVMLATYPDVFRAGAPIAGLPYKCAMSMMDAFSCMSPGIDKTPTAWGDLARSGYSGYSGIKPRVSIWQGTADTTVKPMNMDETMQQWTNYHGISQTAAVSDTVKGYPRKVYKDASGRALVETYSITNFTHATPIEAGTGTDQCGVAAAYIVDAKICSSYYIGKFFGIIGASDTVTSTTSTSSTSTSSSSTTTSSTTTTTVAGACFKTSNYNHVISGRAYNSMGYAKANGSNQNMGLNNTYTITKLRQKGSNYYVIDSTCP